MDKNSLFILWTGGERITFDEMVYMYAFNSKKHNWWENVTLIIWGASTELVEKDFVIQQKLRELADIGVQITACKACAENLKVSKTFAELDIDVKYWGVPLTEVLKSDAKLITV